MSYHILVVDDEKELADVIELYLTGSGCTDSKSFEMSGYYKDATSFQADFRISGHFTSFRKPFAADRLFQCPKYAKIRIYRKVI